MIADLLLQGNRERDRVVGELAGWHIEFQSDIYFLVPPGNSLGTLYVGGPFNGADTEDAAWVLCAPYYSTSIEAAFSLIADLDVTLKTTGGNHELRWACSLSGWRHDLKKAPYISKHGATAPLAICNAWLAWKEVRA
jgi:hypothetical protein